MQHRFSVRAFIRGSRACGVFAATAAMCFLLISCSNRSITRPHSEIVQEAQERGVRVRTAEQDRMLYESFLKKNTRRMQSLVEARQRFGIRSANYRIGPGDEVELNVFDVEELNVTVRVRESGYLSVPLLGAVRAAGLTEAELEKDLAKRLEDYVIKPQLSVFVSNFGSQKVSILGAVKNPGSYSLKKGKNTILEMISLAGGLSEKAGNHVNFIPVELSASQDLEFDSRARISFEQHSRSQAAVDGLEMDLEQLMGTSGRVPVEIPVRGGDMIIIPEGGRIMVEGEVESRGSYELGTRMTLLGALAAAGGITYGAKVDEVEIVRPILDDRVHLVVDLQALMSGEERDILLRNGDVVRVPSDSSRRMKQDTFESITRIINFGVGGSVNLAK